MGIVLSDFELLANLRLGSKDAFDAIYQKNSRPIYLYLLDKLKDPDLCNDALQDIFVYLWEKKEVISVETSLRAYLFQAARYKIIDLYRQNSKLKTYLSEFADTLDIDPRNILKEIDQKKQLEDVKKTIDSMPARMREIFILSRFEHQTTNDIATKTNLSPQTVKNQISKALRILRMNFTGINILYLLFHLFSK